MSSLGIQQTEQIAAYIGQLVRTDLRGSDVDVRMPRWPIDLLEDIHFIAKLLVQAIKNQSEVKDMCYGC